MSSAERVNVPLSLPERTSLAEESCFLCSITSHLRIQRALFITPFLGIHTKMLNFLLSLIFSCVPTETERMLSVHHVLSLPSPKPESRNISSRSSKQILFVWVILSKATRGFSRLIAFVRTRCRPRCAQVVRYGVPDNSD